MTVVPLRLRGAHVRREHAADLVQMGNETVDLDRPHVVAHLAGDLVQRERPVVQHAPELLEEHCSVEEREVVSAQDPNPAELGELLHRR